MSEEQDPDLVLLDLHLARASTGFSVAVRLNDLGVPCLFVSGKAPRFHLPDLALGCLMQPFTAEDLLRWLDEPVPAGDGPWSVGHGRGPPPRPRDAAAEDAGQFDAL